MLGFNGGLCNKQQGEGAGQRGHTVHQVDGDGKPSLTPTEEKTFLYGIGLMKGFFQKFPIYTCASVLL